MSEQQLESLVGDNAFLGVSHLSQQRARERSIAYNPCDVEHATELVKLSLQNGASGFMFTVSNTTLSILEGLDHEKKPDLYAIVPYAYEYVRLATQIGGISGLAKWISRKIILSRNITTVIPNIIGLIRTDPAAVLRIYLAYEISRIKAAAGKKANLKSVLLHEVITDMALALDLDWFFKSYVKYLVKLKVKPGFETRNFPYLVQKLKEWEIDLNELTVAAFFNPIGFQMNPSKTECEKALESVSGSQIIAMSILASGRVKPPEAMNYIQSLPNLAQVVVGVSNSRQATETFRLIEQFSKLNPLLAPSLKSRNWR